VGFRGPVHHIKMAGHRFFRKDTIKLHPENAVLGRFCKTVLNLNLHPRFHCMDQWANVHVSVTVFSQFDPIFLVNQEWAT
jgi:hypothetical protein